MYYTVEETLAKILEEKWVGHKDFSKNSSPKNPREILEKST